MPSGYHGVLVRTHERGSVAETRRFSAVIDLLSLIDPLTTIYT